MKGFEELKSQWERQPKLETPKEGAKQLMVKIRAIRQKQRITNIVLGCSGLVLVFFFFYISAYRFQTLMFGLLLMIGALVLRMAIEFYSIKSLKRLNMLLDVSAFKQQLTSYYSKRKKVHFIITPLIIFMYCVGFITLLPAFKANLSSAFYTYIIVSSIVVFVILGLFIAKQIQNELRILKGLNT